jgi:hypothetical protein
MPNQALETVIVMVNNETNSIAVTVTTLRDELAGGDPPSQAQLDQLSAIAARLHAIAADPNDPVPVAPTSTATAVPTSAA